MKRLLIFFWVLSPLLGDQVKQEKRADVALCIVATGDYIDYAKDLIQSSRTHFLKRHSLTYIVFSDRPIDAANDIVQVPITRRGWPYDSMGRFEIMLNHADLLEGYDYIFCSDADMLMVDAINEEILGDLVAVQHPGFIDGGGTFETNRDSTAFTPSHLQKVYYCGGFYGGKLPQLKKLWEKTSININQDLKKGIVAIWHDESHINCFLAHNPPSVTLSSAYCFTEAWPLPYPKKIIAIDKDHEALRQL